MLHDLPEAHGSRDDMEEVIMALKILKQKREELRQLARFFNRRHNDGTVSVRANNLLRDCAKLTVAIIVLQHAGL